MRCNHFKCRPSFAFCDGLHEGLEGFVGTKGGEGGIGGDEDDPPVVNLKGVLEQRERANAAEVVHPVSFITARGAKRLVADRS